MKTIQERLRHIASKGVSVWGDLQMEAADKIDALEAEIQILTAEREVYAATADRAIAEVAEYSKCADDAAMKHKVERDALMADKEVLLNHMATLRNVTKEPQVSLLTRLVLERMAHGGGK